MKCMKNIGLLAVFGLLVGFALSPPAEAQSVSITTLGVGTPVTGLGSQLTPPGPYDEVGFTGKTTNLDMVADPNVALTVKLGTLTFTQGQNCGGQPCSDPVDSQLQFTISSGGEQQLVTLLFQWQQTPDLFNDTIRESGSLAFFGPGPVNPFDGSPAFNPNRIVFRAGFADLVITLLQPQDIVDAASDGSTTSRDIKAIIQLVPEPSSFALLGVGLLALALSRRKHANTLAA
ncbi:MAG: PEP-CTERM sorting domain-containing protein [Proteobacteria bacterium]|nr:PEP-CTERM sorting domain-containing protein [Pseudomonadota bacterium]